MFFTFSKFYRWYQIAQRITYLGCYQYISVINAIGEYTDRSKFYSNVYFSRGTHCVKSLRIRSYSSPHFPAYGLNTERYGVPFLIQYKWGKTRTRITPNMDIFYSVTLLHTLLHAKNSRKLFHIADSLFEKLSPIIVRWIYKIFWYQVILKLSKKHSNYTIFNQKTTKYFKIYFKYIN